ncbi:hypothetical protein QFC21_006946 [Naganishia friedmannii]|uniref:Uncharacterized protein n=1 Tax=Naganishia friedmannii TaxID=89922 RepID=A0ACC2UYN8_9TREE|nr:hypothetical protein QFC21_006946 [Naganishia friedmannii]
MAPVLRIRQDAFETGPMKEALDKFIPSSPTPAPSTQNGAKNQTPDKTSTEQEKASSTSSDSGGGWFDFLNLGSDDTKIATSVKPSHTTTILPISTASSSPTQTSSEASPIDTTQSSDGWAVQHIKAIESGIGMIADASGPKVTATTTTTPPLKSQEATSTTSSSVEKPTGTEKPLSPSERLSSTIGNFQQAISACQGGYNGSTSECTRSLDEHFWVTVFSNGLYILLIVGTLGFFLLAVYWMFRKFRKNTKNSETPTPPAMAQTAT